MMRDLYLGNFSKQGNKLDKIAPLIFYGFEYNVYTEILGKYSTRQALSFERFKGISENQYKEALIILRQS